MKTNSYKAASHKQDLALLDEDPDVAEQSGSFTGLTHRRMGPDRIEVTFGGIKQNLVGLLADYPLPRGVTDAHPIGTDGFGMLDEPVSAANPVRIELLEVAQRITGTVAIIVLKISVGGGFTFCALSRNVNAQGPTTVVWRELMRLVHHHLAKRYLPLVFSKIGDGPPRGRGRLGAE